MAEASFPDCTLALIIGGRGVRLGGLVKSQLRLPDGQTILARTRGLLGSQVDETVLCGPPGLAGGDLRRLPDLIADRGAAAGVHAACAGARTTWVLALAGDLPFVSLDVLRLLWAHRDGVDVVVATGPASGFEPLHAFYRASTCAQAFGERLQSSGSSFGDLYTLVRTCTVPAEEVRAVDPMLASFDNINTWEDVTRHGLRPPT